MQHENGCCVTSKHMYICNSYNLQSFEISGTIRYYSFLLEMVQRSFREQSEVSAQPLYTMYFALKLMFDIRQINESVMSVTVLTSCNVRNERWRITNYWMLYNLFSIHSLTVFLYSSLLQSNIPYLNFPTTMYHVMYHVTLFCHFVVKIGFLFLSIFERK